MTNGTEICNQFSAINCWICICRQQFTVLIASPARYCEYDRTSCIVQKLTGWFTHFAILKPWTSLTLLTKISVNKVHYKYSSLYFISNVTFLNDLTYCLTLLYAYRVAEREGHRARARDGQGARLRTTANFSVVICADYKTTPGSIKMHHFHI